MAAAALEFGGGTFNVTLVVSDGPNNTVSAPFSVTVDAALDGSRHDFRLRMVLGRVLDGHRPELAAVNAALEHLRTSPADVVVTEAATGLVQIAGVLVERLRHRRLGRQAA